MHLTEKGVGGAERRYASRINFLIFISKRSFKVHITPFTAAIIAKTDTTK